MDRGGAPGWATPPVWIGVACALVSMPAFVAIQRRSRHPMLDLSLFSERSRSLAYAAASMLQNSGYVVSTAMSLAIVTSPLNRADKRLAYEGTPSELPRHSLAAFTQGYRTAFLVLATACAIRLVASLSRSRT